MTAAPEAAAKHTLHDVLDTAFGPSVDVGVFRGPPPSRPTERQVIWVGGHDADERAATAGRPDGPSTEDVFRVTVMVDVVDPDPSPAGAAAADDAALELLHQVRRTIRKAIGDRVDIPSDDGGVHVRWGHIASHRSDGPAQLEGSNGWVSTVAVDVSFTARIR